MSTPPQPQPGRRLFKRNDRRKRAPIFVAAPHATQGVRAITAELDLADVCVDEKGLIGSYSLDFELQREAARVVFRGNSMSGR